ncbi:carbamoyl-phosphate synthase large subunit [Mycoplasma todarodis]|uniref:Carbamoyl phosphate synthase large chain n=1 Tax=Mycoplasma todarodis TaxID=1937191 RepID=A0A4R0XSJ0_9MOLU|nr:carbamoyl-phosphate synthase large subunit [Mycoplasma todarodis]TCG11390.1 carbamoyl-phosphate synthase large subunit [Mycoplasma todarodis]
MPARKDIKRILVLGSGPIVIGSAAEFDYSGTQACLALKELGYEVILVNPNPATIMTDKEIADKVYMEPLTVDFVKWIASIEKPDAIIPNLGGQTALNLCVELHEAGILDRYNIEILGPPIESIIGAEDRNTFKEVMEEMDIPMAPSIITNNLEEGLEFAEKIGYPVIIRPSYTMGGSGGGIATNIEELKTILSRGIRLSPINECMVEKSIAGFKEVEYEVMRDANDTAIVVCNMENIDPVGIHTGDSMVVAPSLTLTNKQYQMLRDVSLRIIKRFKIQGGCNVQIALDEHSDQFYIIEINPRVSRSSALASKATGYPIARISAMIAVGMRLDEILNPITKTTYASFEPSIDYVVTKLARFPFDKFRSNKSDISTYMQATGETMAIGQSFEESFLKSIRSLDAEFQFTWDDKEDFTKESLIEEMKNPTAYRIWQIFNAFRVGATVEEIYEATKINKFFLRKFEHIIKIEFELKENKGDIKTLEYSKKFGFSDYGVAKLWDKSELEVYKLREQENIKPVYKMIDTCGGEFESKTNYLYSTYNGFDNESRITKKKKVIIIGSGPIRIGQGVEFDYSTVHSIWSFKKLGYETIVINNNPETVSTDFSIADKLYFEPINFEEVKEIIDMEKPDGVVLQFGGQTAINVAEKLREAGVEILGTQIESMDISEDRKKFEALLKKEGITQPNSKATKVLEDLPKLALEIGYPVLIRPSYVIGGKGMQVVYNEKELKDYLKLNALDYVDNMVLIDKYLAGKEIEVDCVSDGEEIFIPGIMEHIEKSGIHSGDSTTVYPTVSLKDELKAEIVETTRKLAKALKVKGLMNIQYIVYEDTLYVLEVNLRSSRTIPFISKSTRKNVVEMAVQVLDGKKITEITDQVGEYKMDNEKYYVKSPVFSFHKLYKVTDTILGPEMKSTGESIGIDYNLDKALYKSLLGANFDPLKHSKVILSVADDAKEQALKIAKNLRRVKIKIYATPGTAKYLRENGIEVNEVKKLDGSNNIIDLIKNEKISYIVNIPTSGNKSINDARNIRMVALKSGVPVITSIRLGRAIARMTEFMRFLVNEAY